MGILSLKNPESLLERLDQAALKRAESRSALLHEAIEILTMGENELRFGSCMNLACEAVLSQACFQFQETHGGHEIVIELREKA